MCCSRTSRRRCQAHSADPDRRRRRRRGRSSGSSSRRPCPPRSSPLRRPRPLHRLSLRPSLWCRSPPSRIRSCLFQGCRKPRQGQAPATGEIEGACSSRTSRADLQANATTQANGPRTNCTRRASPKLALQPSKFNSFHKSPPLPLPRRDPRARTCQANFCRPSGSLSPLSPNLLGARSASHRARGPANASPLPPPRHSARRARGEGMYRLPCSSQRRKRFGSSGDRRCARRSTAL